MKKATKKNAPAFTKTKYTPPTLKLLGNVKKLTLKTGSSTDGFGTFA
ncbi:hypothetical protein [Spirosoma aerophilum]